MDEVVYSYGLQRSIKLNLTLANDQPTCRPKRHQPFEKPLDIFFDATLKLCLIRPSLRVDVDSEVSQLQIDEFLEGVS